MEYFFNFEKMAYVMGLKDSGCMLCSIAEKKESVVDLTVYEDPLFLVVVNLYPYNPGHLMVFPRRHIEDVRQMTVEKFPLYGINQSVSKHPGCTLSPLRLQHRLQYGDLCRCIYRAPSPSYHPPLSP
jgi:hypothetical protein